MHLSQLFAVRFSPSTTLDGELVLRSWFVQLRLSLLLLGLLKGLGSSTPSLGRLIGNSSIFLLGSFIVQFKVFIDSHCGIGRRECLLCVFDVSTQN